MRNFFIFMLLSCAAMAQSTTTVTGTIKDLSAAVVTSGQVTFDLRPGLDTTISGAARFVPSSVICTINGSGLIKALDGVSACVVVQNTSLTPNGTYYKVCIQPYSITPGSCFNWYALASSFDITTAVPTPATAPAFTFLDLITSQTISGVKTFTAVPVFSAGISGTLGQTLALPALADTLVGRATTDTLTNKTLTSPTSTGADSGTETLSNKTLASPVITGTVSGGVTISGGASITGNINLIGGQLNSTLATGTPPFVVASVTPVVNLAACPTGYDHAGGLMSACHVIRDKCTLGTDCVVTLGGSAAYTNANTYECNGTDGTAAAAVMVNQIDGLHVTFTGTGTDVIRYTCIGN